MGNPWDDFFSCPVPWYMWLVFAAMMLVFCAAGSLIPIKEEMYGNEEESVIEACEAACNNQDGLDGDMFIIRACDALIIEYGSDGCFEATPPNEMEDQELLSAWYECADIEGGAMQTSRFDCKQVSKAFYERIGNDRHRTATNNFANDRDR